MKRYFLISFTIAVIVIGILAWAPWINGPYAKERAVSEFERAWLNVADGCGFGCHGCGAIETKKILFGMQVKLEYACGMLPADSPEFHQQTDAYVSFLGKVYGYPTP